MGNTRNNVDQRKSQDISKTLKLAASVSKGGLLQQPAVPGSGPLAFVVDDLLHLELSMCSKAEPSGMEQTLCTLKALCKHRVII